MNATMRRRIGQTLLLLGIGLSALMFWHGHADHGAITRGDEIIFALPAIVGIFAYYIFLHVNNGRTR
jgi:hypothetical protein